jgi:hypothetical protein
MAPHRNWDPRRHPRLIVALALALIGLALFIASRLPGAGAGAAVEASSDTMCVAARIGLSCR